MFRKLQTCKVKIERVKHCIPRVWGSRVKTCPLACLLKLQKLRIKHVCKAYWILLFKMNLLSDVHFPVF